MAMAAGKNKGLTFRAIGGAAVMLLCDSSIADAQVRTETDDVDLLGRYEQQMHWQPLFEALGFRLTGKSTTIRAAQYEFVGQFAGAERQVHLFANPLHSTELVPGPYFTELWSETIPPTSLLLSKLLIKREGDQEAQRSDLNSLLRASDQGKFELDFNYLRAALKCGMTGWRRSLFAQEALTPLCGRFDSREALNADRSGAVKLWRLLQSENGDWRWRCARWMHQRGLPGPVYMNDHVEPLVV